LFQSLQRNAEIGSIIMKRSLGHTTIYLLSGVVALIGAAIGTFSVPRGMSSMMMLDGECDDDLPVPVTCVLLCEQEQWLTVGAFGICGPPCEIFGEDGNVADERTDFDTWYDNLGCESGDLSAECWDALYCEWAKAVLACCAAWDLWEEEGSCNWSTGSSDINCDDLSQFIEDMNDFYYAACDANLSDQQTYDLICCFLEHCRDEWDGDDPEFDFCGTDLRSCIDSILTDSTVWNGGHTKDALTADEWNDLQQNCLGCCCVELEIGEFSGDSVYYSNCGGSFDCERDGQAGVTCEDLKRFISSSQDCNLQPLSRDQILDLICLFLSQCPTFECEALHNCINEILEEEIGETEPPLTQEEIDRLAADCKECTLNLSDVRSGDTGVGEGGDRPCPTEKQSKPIRDDIVVDVGDKYQSAVDLTVPVPGRDFVLTHEYTSNPDFQHEAFPDGWVPSVTQWVEFNDAADTFTLHLSVYEEIVIPSFTGAGPWNLPGPTSQTVEKTDVTIEGDKYPVWRVREPGAWIKDYFRANEAGESGSNWVTVDAALVGLLLQTRDEYGDPANNRNVHTYEWIVYPGPTDDAARLRAVYLNGAPGMTGNPDALVLFTWNLNPDDASFGRLQKVRVTRYTTGGSPQPVVTERVEYTYLEYGAIPGGGTGNSPLGSAGDMIQVTRAIDIDRNLAGGAAERIQISQYRYHDGETNETSTDTDTDGYIEQGNIHQMKYAIAPEQIEYGAQMAGAQIEFYASNLLNLADGGTAFMDGTTAIKVSALAATVVAKYETTGDKRVTEQYAMSSCGCGTGATQGTQLTYSYQAYDSNTKWSTQVTEKKWNGSSWDLHRTHHYDLEELGPVGYKVPYLFNHAVVEGSNEWVTRYEYDSNRNIQFLFTPSSVDNYAPRSGGTGPTVTKNTTGLVYKYTYTTDNRLNETWVKKGTSATEYQISEVTYGSGSGSERVHLPKKIERFRVEGSSAANDIETAEFIYGYHGGSGNDIAWIETKVEAELVAENGPAGSYYTYELFNNEGDNHWSRAADGTITKREFQASTDAVTKVIRNHDGTGLPSNGSGEYDGMGVTYSTWTSTDRNGDGGSLTTEYERDLLGRVIERIGPNLVSTYTMRELREWPERPGFAYYAEVTLPHHISGTSYDGPVTINWYNAGDSLIGTVDHTIGSGGYTFASGVLTNWDETNGAIIAQSSVVHDLSGLVEEQEVWHDVAGNRSYITEFEYDTLGRLQTTIDPLGTYTKNTYDIFDRVTKVEVGTSGSNQVTVAEYFYDSGGTSTSGVGNGNLTLLRQHVNDTSGNDRDTIYAYDWRDRLTKTTNELPPNRFVVYDNLDRPVEEALFETTGSNWTNMTDIDDSARRAERGLYKKTEYSQRGLVFAQSIAIDPTVAKASMTFLASHRWFDEVGRTVGAWSPNSPGTKSTFDGLGRPETTYITNRGGDAAPGATGNHADVYDSTNHEAKVNGDQVIEQRDYRYISGSTPATHAGMLDLVTTRRRAHDATSSDTGALSGLSSAKSIVTFTGTYFDGADRVIRSVNWGTNQTGFNHGGSAPTITQSSPLNWDSSGDQLVTETAYNTRGLVDTSTDPTGKKTKHFYDDLSRTIAVAENYVNATVTWSTDRWVVGNITDAELDTDRVTSFVYDGGNNVVKQVAHFPVGTTEDTQITIYTYGVIKGVSAGDSDIYHNGLLKSVEYPDTEAGTEDTVFYAYNRLGETRWMKDQNGSIHTYTRDDMGRVTVDAGTKAGSGPGANIDDTIDSIELAYDTFGRASTVVSKDSTTVINGVKFEYTKLWQISKVWQDVDGNTFSGGTPNTQYTYTNSAVTSGNFSRLTTLTYPGAESWDYNYGSSGTLNDVISRVNHIVESTNPFGIAGNDAIYSYIGLGMVSDVDLGIPDVQLDYQVKHNGARTAGEYAGFDRFGRVIRQPWVDGNLTTHATDTTLPNIPPIVELTYSYDKASNRTKMLDGRPGAKQSNRDMVYTYDDLHRLEESKRGVDGGTFTFAIGSQKWALDMLGNWKTYSTDTVGDGDYLDTGEETDRQHNDVNELTGLDLDNNGTFEIVPTFDHSGNMREMPFSTTSKYRLTHDLWNRLVKVEVDKAGWNTVGEYEYFGTHWRSIKKSDTNGNASLDEKRELYYSAGWQLIEERVDDNWTSGFTADRNLQNLRGIRYIDDIVMHREDHDGDGSFSDAGTLRWWHLTDAQFSTIANLDDAATLQERVMYDSYGRALHRDDKDVDGDRDFDSTDRGIVNTLSSVGPGGTLITSVNYNADADMDRDGDVDSTDLTLIGTSYVSALAAGRLSNSTVKNTIGWDGYVFNSEVSGAGLYHVRFRWYSPELGRWMERDPVGYVDGMHLYCYARVNPLLFVDPSGLNDRRHPADDGVPDPWPYLAHLLYQILFDDGCKVECEEIDIHVIGWGKTDAIEQSQADPRGIIPDIVWDEQFMKNHERYVYLVMSTDEINTSVAQAIADCKKASNTTCCCVKNLHIWGHGRKSSQSVGYGGNGVANWTFSRANADALLPIKDLLCDDAMIILHGCSVADGDTGRAFLREVANHMERSVKAWTGDCTYSEKKRSHQHHGEEVVMPPGQEETSNGGAEIDTSKDKECCKVK
jgi:RHS repeat-associated protein